MSETVVHTYNIFVNSEYRSSGTPTYFALKLRQPIVLSNPGNFFRLRVVSFECPYSFHSINNTNNQVYVRVIHDTFNNLSILTITPGNYNIISLLNELKAKLIDKFVTVTGQNPNSFTLNFIYSRDAGKVTLNIVRNSSHALTFIIYWSGNVLLGEFFGFTSDTTLSYLNNGTVTSSNYISQQNVNCSPITALYLRSDNLTQLNNWEALVENEVSVSDILQKIQVVTPPNSYIFYAGENSLDCDITNKIIDVLSIYLTDNLSYNEIDLNGLNFSFRLNIQEIQPTQEAVDAKANVASNEPRTDIEISSRVTELEAMRDEILNELENMKQKINS